MICAARSRLRIAYALRLPALAVALVVASCGGPAIPAQPRPTPLRDPEALVRAYYDRVDREDLPGVLALFVSAPRLEEPFSEPGSTTVRTGYREVAEFYAEAFARSDDHIVPEFVDVRGNDVIVGWSLSSRAGEGYSGLAWFRVNRGLIERLQLRRRE